MCYLILFTFMVCISCSEESTSVDEKEEPTNSFYQVPGCASSPLMKTIQDSTCFFYSFFDTLKVDLCLPSNCCPENNRFDSSFLLDGSTIKFTVLDTAAHLCDCICDYVIHTEIDGLTKNEYTFKCIYYDSVYYSETVSR
ncbi:hypothetical protein ACFLS9_00810 [Bacteroidota bacterium]